MQKSEFSSNENKLSNTQCCFIIGVFCAAVAKNRKKTNTLYLNANFQLRICCSYHAVSYPCSKLNVTLHSHPQGQHWQPIRNPFKLTSPAQHALRRISETSKDHFMDAGYK